MSIYTFVPVIFIVLYLGYWFYMKKKNSQQAQVVNNTDFKAEFANAEQYKNLCLNSDLSFLKEAMGEEKIDAFNYASNEYGVASALKYGMKDKLKGMATLGTVRFNTVQTPKYLVLSGDNLHLFDTDTDGEIDNHFVFNQARLENSRYFAQIIPRNLRRTTGKAVLTHITISRYDYIFQCLYIINQYYLKHLFTSSIHLKSLLFHTNKRNFQGYFITFYV